MSRLSIRLRITAAFAVAMAVVLAGSGLFLYLRLSSHLALALDRELQLRAQDLAALVSQPNASLARDSASPFVERGESYAQLVAADGYVLDATQPLGSRPVLSAAELRAARRGSVYLDKQSVPGLDEPSRILATTVRRDGKPLVLVVGATSENDAETLASFREELLVAGPIALTLASLVGYLLAGLSLRQVESMRRRASAISADAPGERLPVPPTGDELQRLGETLNEMLDRLEAALERERDFVADAGHELRTPLALLRTELELALRQAQTADELREAVRWSSFETERLSQLAEDLLLIARADRGRLPLRIEAIDVDVLFASVTGRFAWRAEELGKDLRSCPAPGLSVEADRLRLEQALGNLVDNALRHGGDEISLTAVRADGDVELHVVDNGGGFDSAFLARAFDRFTRADPARAGSSAGLGLSIVRTIAEAHGGSSHVANREPAGTDAWVSLPSRVHEPVMLQRNPTTVTALAIALIAVLAPTSTPLPPSWALHGKYAPSVNPANFVAAIDNRYFPLKPGTGFHYRGVKGASAQTDDMVVTAQTKDVLGVRCTVVRDTVSEHGKPLERTFDWYAQDKQGNVWYMGENALELKNGRFVRAADSWEAGVNGAKPGIIMPASPRPGQVYRQEYYPPGGALDQARVIGTNSATVHVPAGTFRRPLVTVEWSPVEPQYERKYYVAGLGEVMEQVTQGGHEQFQLVEVTH